MNHLKLIALSAAAATALSAGAASAATIWATGVVWSGGGVSDGTPNASVRNDLDNALGAPDDAFLSLGVGGSATFTFGQPFTANGVIFEVTWGSRGGHVESADIYLDGVYFTGITNQGATQDSLPIHLSFAGGPFTTLTITDTSSASGGRDGFDINAVGVSPIPVPAAGLLLAGGLAALGAQRKLRRKA